MIRSSKVRDGLQRVPFVAVRRAELSLVPVLSDTRKVMVTRHFAHDQPASVHCGPITCCQEHCFATSCLRHLGTVSGSFSAQISRVVCSVSRCKHFIRRLARRDKTGDCDHDQHCSTPVATRFVSMGSHQVVLEVTDYLRAAPWLRKAYQYHLASECVTHGFTGSRGWSRSSLFRVMMGGEAA